MTPQQHIDKAEQLLAATDAAALQAAPADMANVLLAAVAHALIALAVEGGVPHSTPTPEGS